MRLKERVDRLTLQMKQLEEQSMAPSLPPITSYDVEFEKLEARVADMERLVTFLNRERERVSTPDA